MGQAEARAAEAAVKLQVSRLAAAVASKASGTAAARSKQQQAVRAAEAAAALFLQLGLQPQYIMAVLEQVEVMGAGAEVEEDQRPGLQERLALLKVGGHTVAPSMLLLRIAAHVQYKACCLLVCCCQPWLCSLSTAPCC